MKMQLLAIAAGVCAMMAACSGKDTVTTDTSVLPDKATTLIKDNYGDVKIAQIKVEKETMGDEYEVTLANGTQVDFNSDGTLEKVKAGRNDSIPSSIIPAEISQYVKDTYPEQYIVKYEIDGKEKEIELSSGLDIKFDIQNTFVKVD